MVPHRRAVSEDGGEKGWVSLKIGIVGLSLTHPYAFTEIIQAAGHEVPWVWDDSPEKSSDFARKYGATVVADPQVIVDRGVDGVLVCSVSGDHARLSLPFIQRGIPTFVDKALATSLSDAEVMISAARRTGAVLMSASAIRFAPSIVALRKKAAGGALGQIVAANAWVAHSIKGYMEGFSRWQDNIEQGGGSIVNMGIHAVEPIISCLGTAVESVYCQASKLVFPESQSEDTALLQMRYADGRLASIQLLCGTSFHGYFVTLHGTTVSAQGGAPSHTVQRLDGGGMGLADYKEEYGYAGMIHAFLEGIAAGQCPIPLEETEIVIKTLMAARRSAAEGRPVRLDEMPREENRSAHHKD